MHSLLSALKISVEANKQMKLLASKPRQSRILPGGQLSVLKKLTIWDKAES